MHDQAAPVTLKATDLRRRFGDREVVQGVNLELRRGEVLGLLGPNGAGKSTTLRMLTGNLAVEHGRIEICGVDLRTNPIKAKSNVGYLPEPPPLYKDWNVDDYLVLCAKIRRIEKTKLSSAIKRVIELCQLASVRKQLIGTLSRGYQQRVGIAQAIIHEPEVLILDEPTVGLDPNQIRDIRSLIRDIGNLHSVILSTHILQEIDAVCDKVEIMHWGKLVYSGSLGQVTSAQPNPVLVVGFRRPPTLDDIAAIPGVTSVNTLSETLFQINFTAGADPTSAVISAATNKDWDLFQITPAKTSLEDLFIQLTQRGQTP